MNFETQNTDILIIGSGGAGLFAALHAMKSNPENKITIAVKGLIGKCGCTRMVQGGYNVALASGDSVERHFMDTIIGGKWLPNQDIAWRLCKTAVERIQELENEVGCFFDRNKDGTIHQKAFAGQTFDRTVHKGDLTGIEIINRLMEQVLSRPVEKLQEHRVISIIPDKDGTQISGALFIDMRKGIFRFVKAKAILMATGGGPTMYKYHTPSGDKSMDGLSIAMRLGLPLRDMEMVQFHPTGMLAGDHTRMTGTVLEEGLRGAGGKLLNNNNERFMFNYDDLGERATRDVVSRAIYAEMQTKKRSPNGGVYISMSHLGPENVKNKFPGMVKRCADSGFDLASGKVEVVPTAHYFMGGVIVDTDTRTSLRGLYVAGEDAGGAHGSNRLGGNGVANSTVYGGISGDVMTEDIKKIKNFADPDNEKIYLEIEKAKSPFNKNKNSNPKDILFLRKQLMDVMWEKVGIIRDEKNLKEGIIKITNLEQNINNIGMDDKNLEFNITWHDWLNLRSLVDISKVIAKASLERTDSRGAHFRKENPESGPLEESKFTVAQIIEGDLKVTEKPVDFSIVKPGQSLLKNDEPTSMIEVAE